MFSYPYGYSTFSPYESDNYRRALAEERAAQEQYTAALRAEETARQRAERARRARQAYASHYNSYLSDEAEDVEDDSFLSGHRGLSPRLGFGSLPSGHGVPPQQRRALLEEQRRRELLERERELERTRLLEEERKRQAAEEERSQRLQEEEEIRKRLTEEQEAERETELQGRLDEQEHQRPRRRRQSDLEQFLNDLGFRSPRFEQPEMPHGRRARTTSPIHRQSVPSQRATHPQQQPPKPPVAQQSPKPKEPTATPEQAAAATKIEKFYLRHAPRRRALKTIADISSRFATLRNNFTLPSKLDFEHNDTQITVNASLINVPIVSSMEEDLPCIPSLAYTSNTAPLLQYDEELNRLLFALDAVESNGDKTIRQSRRDLSRKVEREAERIERWKVAVWRSRKEDAPTDVSVSQEPQLESMAVDVPSGTSEVAPTVDAKRPVDLQASSFSATTAQEPSLSTDEGSGSEMGESTLETPKEVPVELPSDSVEASEGKTGGGPPRQDGPLVDQDWRVLDELMF